MQHVTPTCVGWMYKRGKQVWWHQLCEHTSSGFCDKKRIEANTCQTRIKKKKLSKDNCFAVFSRLRSTHGLRTRTTCRKEWNNLYSFGLLLLGTCASTIVSCNLKYKNKNIKITKKKKNHRTYAFRSSPGQEMPVTLDSLKRYSLGVMHLHYVHRKSLFAL